MKIKIAFIVSIIFCFLGILCSLLNVSLNYNLSSTDLMYDIVLILFNSSAIYIEIKTLKSIKEVK